MKAFLKALDDMQVRLSQLPDVIDPFAVQAVRDNIKNAPHKANAPLTKKLKNGGAKPLFDSGELYASITSEREGLNVIVGTNKVYAPLVNSGGLVKPKRARQLAIPTTLGVKRKSDALGVRALLKSLESQGWKIFYRPHSIIGRAPVGGKALGLKINSKLNRSNKKANKGVAYVLFRRVPKVKVPGRQFMLLTDEQQTRLNAMAKAHLKGRS
ncbi:hypothetical protein [Vibrio mediterranei]|uniref:hypothetical protein n=1 Tax=Vibrio mediterranei TaxID=689 RepID=UPI002284B3D2|nr:hypothetical protein [Vibrio mediterranei]MCY9855818.1 hypothetical protein [Vibrio mediterranei]